MAKNQERYLFGVDARVLLLLLEHGEIARSAFSKKYGVTYSGANNALLSFREKGLTDFEEHGDFRDTMVWRLTPKGEKVARMLAELVDIIEENGGAREWKRL